MTALALTAGYALLGAAWLMWKTEGPVHDRARKLAWPLAVALIASIGIVSLWTPFLNERFMARWLSWPAILYAAPVPLLTALAAWRLLVSIRDGREREPFLMTLALFVLSYIGLGISLYPYMVPTAVTIWEAAAPAKSVELLLVGAVVLIPLILAYTAYAYWVFRGKVDPQAGYH